MRACSDAISAACAALSVCTLHSQQESFTHERLAAVVVKNA